MVGNDPGASVIVWCKRDVSTARDKHRVLLFLKMQGHCVILISVECHCVRWEPSAILHAKGSCQQLPVAQTTPKVRTP